MGELALSSSQEIRSLMSGQLKIRDLKNDATIAMSLAYGMELTGLKVIPKPGSLERQVLIDFIISEYKGLCAEEIKLAFKSACSGKFEVETNHYQNFSSEYLGRVLNAYRTFKEKELASKQPSVLKDYQGITENTPEQDKAYYDTVFFTPYKRALEGLKISKEAACPMFRFLETKGITIVSDERKKEIWKEEWGSFGLEKKQEGARAKCKKICRRIALTEFISECKEFGRELDTEIIELIKEK